VPKSKAFEGIKRDILLIIATILEGRITTFKLIETYMGMMPRHIAYILTTLASEEHRTVPWHRVVGEKGKLEKTKFDAQDRGQENLLQAEEISVVKGGVVDFEVCFIDMIEFEHNVQPKKHY